MKNKTVKQMMVDVVKTEMIEVSGKFSNHETIAWCGGPCYICGGNFIWLSEGIVSLTADQLKGIHYE